MASLAKHQENPDYAGWIWAVVEVLVERYFGPDEKICTIPAFILGCALLVAGFAGLVTELVFGFSFGLGF